MASAGPETAPGGGGARLDRKCIAFNSPTSPKQAFRARDRLPGATKRPRLVSQRLVCEKSGLADLARLTEAVAEAKAITGEEESAGSAYKRLWEIPKETPSAREFVAM